MKLPAGIYYIGDPCYVIDYSRWRDFCNTFYASQNGELTEFDGYPLFVADTAYGDGSYFGSDGVDYGVDAGLIGIVPIELCKKADGLLSGSIVNHKEPFEAVCSARGIFHLGGVTIDTSEEESEEEYYDDDDFEEDDNDSLDN